MKDEEFTRFAMSIAEQACWQQGVGFEFECDAVLGGEFLLDLIRLAAKAPAAAREEFEKEYKL